MDDAFYGDLIYLFAFALAGLGFALGPFAVVYLLSPRGTRQAANKTRQAIECGMDPIGDAWIRYSAVYYLYALVYNDPQFVIRDFIEVALFVGILSLVIVYAWKKGIFEWKRNQTSANS
ncbi:MAG: NADH-quinone oxidoreductase subunit A [Verrucomicrobiota bacterium]